MHSYQYTPYIYPLAIAALVSALLALYFWERRNTVGAKPATVLMLALFIWSTGYMLEFMGANLETKLLWAKIQYFGIVTLPVSLLVFALEFSGHQSQVTAPQLAALIIIPVVTLLLAITNEMHLQIWSSWNIEPIGETLVLHLEHGVAFWVNIVFTYLLLVLSTVLIVRTLVHRSGLYRGQMGSMLVGIAAPWIGNVVSNLGLLPFPIDLTPFGFTITGIAIAWGIFRHNLMNIAPIAYETVFKSMNDAVFILDTQNRVSDINPVGQKTLSLTANQAIGQHARTVFKEQADLLDRFQYTMDMQEEIAITQGSRTGFYEISISPLVDHKNRPVGRAIVLHDITERKQAEIVMEEARDQALKTAQMKSQFLSRMSHELRAPLGVIRGYADLLNEPAYGTLNETQSKAVKEIIESNQRVADMVNELLDEARLSSGAVQLENLPFKPVDILEDAQGKLSILTQKKGILLTTELDPALPPQLVGDSTRLNQMVTNLVSNSIKFTQQGGIQIKFYCSGNEKWALEVTDTGAGIPKAAHEAIFEPFRQADNTITRKYGGTGLGLSIVKHLTGLMGGEITLKSELGKGTTFTIVLPLCTEIPA